MTCIRAFWPAAALLALALAARAQDTVEHAAATANATSATGMRNVGKSAASVLDKVAKTLDQAAAPAAGSSTAVVRKPEPAVKVTAPDPALIAAGMDREELLRKFGQPAMKTSGAEDPDDAETWWYGSGSETVTVKLVAGKVRAVSPPARPAAEARTADTVVTVLP